jgi:LPXTG-motif cell wall-anchored protein
MKKKLLTTGAMVLLGLVVNAQGVIAAEVPVSNSTVVMTGGKDRWYSVNVDMTSRFSNEQNIVAGDTVTYTLPAELGLKTIYEFDVTGPDGQVIGHAVANPGTKTIQVTFNDYFESHKLDKSMFLTLRVEWDTSVVPGGGTYTLSIGGANGNASTVTIEDDALPDKNEVLVQYGNQDVENPDKVNYDARVNYRKDELTNVEVTVKPDENQEIIGVKDVRLLSDYKPFTVVRNLTEDEYTWDKDKITIKKSLLKDEMLTFSYTTKIVKPVSDEKVHSVVELKSDNLQWDYNAEVYLVTGSGHGAGDKETPVDPVEPRGSESTETSTTETSTTETSTTETSTTETSTTETSTTEVVTTEDSSVKESKTTTDEQKDDSVVVLEPKSTEAELPNTGTDASTITSALGAVFVALGGLVVRKKKN